MVYKMRSVLHESEEHVHHLRHPSSGSKKGGEGRGRERREEDRRGEEEREREGRGRKERGREGKGKGGEGRLGEGRRKGKKGREEERRGWKRRGGDRRGVRIQFRQKDNSWAGVLEDNQSSLREHRAAQEGLWGGNRKLLCLSVGKITDRCLAYQMEYLGKLKQIHRKPNR